MSLRIVRGLPGSRSGYDQTNPLFATRKSNPSLSISTTSGRRSAIRRTSSASAMCNIVAMHPFRAAIEARDIEAAIALLAEDAEFRSPVTHRTYQGRDAAGVLLRAVFRVFEDFRYVREIGEQSNHA